jgi:hypothetical protein
MPKVEYLEPGRVVSAIADETAPRVRNATGYGRKIPTRYRLKCDDGRTRRVYVMNYGNAGSAYIIMNGRELFLRPETDSQLQAAQVKESADG